MRGNHSCINCCRSGCPCFRFAILAASRSGAAWSPVQRVGFKDLARNRTCGQEAGKGFGDGVAGRGRPPAVNAASGGASPVG
jgi:hypothetical protein